MSGITFWKGGDESKACLLKKFFETLSGFLHFYTLSSQKVFIVSSER
jgi:hypothetical protein